MPLELNLRPMILVDTTTHATEIVAFTGSLHHPRLDKRERLHYRRAI
jgi:hypothetical protein